MSDEGRQEALALLYGTEGEDDGSGNPNHREIPTNGERRQAGGNRPASPNTSNAFGGKYNPSTGRKEYPLWQNATNSNTTQYTPEQTQAYLKRKAAREFKARHPQANSANSHFKGAQKRNNSYQSQEVHDDARIREKQPTRVANAAAAIRVSVVDAEAHIAGQADALREMKEVLEQERGDALAKLKEEREACREAEKEALRQDFLDKMGGMHYWYFDETPFSKMFFVFFFAIFTMSLFCFGAGSVKDGSRLESVWNCLIAGLGSLPLPGPLPLVVQVLDYIVVSFNMYDVLLLSLSWALTGAFMADFTYCLIFNKRFIFWPTAKHEYHLIRTIYKEERTADLRADSNGRGDNKHLNCFYAEIQYTYTLGLYQKTKNFMVSMEVLAQLTGPRIMNLLTDDSMVLQKLVAAGGALDTVNINRAIVFCGINVVSNTEQLAYGFYRHFRRDASELPFGLAPLCQK
jgi:hypothetical protein